MKSATATPSLPPPNPDHLTEKIKHKLLKYGVEPTPKIIHTLRKKHLQKSLRKSKRLDALQPREQEQEQDKTLADEFYFRTISREYKQLTKILSSERPDSAAKMVGRPWERPERGKLRELAPGKGEFETPDSQHLRELGEIFEERKKEALLLMLESDDVESEDSVVAGSEHEHVKRRRADIEMIRFLVDRLCALSGVTAKDWKFSKMMKQSGLQFTEYQLLKIVGELGYRGCWKKAMGVVEWVYARKEFKYLKSRFVYTKLLAVLGQARRPQEALQIFQLMRGDCNIYPDMAAYHSISVTLGQAGLVKELINIVDTMKEKPSKGVKYLNNKKWDPSLQPDVVVFNSVLNACIPSHQWKGVSWVFQQLRKHGLRPKGATFGLAMEVMLNAGKYDLVHELFEKMKRSGEVPNALTYKVLVKTFWKEDNVDKAIDAVRDMEQRGIIRTPSVYYELARCLCNKGRWQEAMGQIEKLKKLPHPKPLVVAFTGLILSAMDGGHVNDCISIFEHMTHHCKPDISAINTMLKVYGRSDMFSEAKALFEKTERGESGTNSNKSDSPLLPDVYTYTSMLKASAHAQQWEYFECVYKEMVLRGYQLDQSKHAWLLVEASSAGKGHLLQHSFETILEAGEIPHSALFTEMVYIALELGDYTRAAAIVNAMAYAPFQVSEKQWTDLIEKNKDRVSVDCLTAFLEVLQNNNIAKEATVFRLLGSLQSFCKSGSARELPSPALTSNSSQEINAEDSGISEVVGLCETKPPSENHSFTADTQLENGSVACDTMRARNPWEGEHNVNSDTHSSYSERVDDVPSIESDDEEEIPELLQLLNIPEDEDPGGSDLPSADEILKAWKKSREGDGFISTFQFG